MQISKDLALIGAGYWGKNLARNFHEMGMLHTLCDPSPEVLSSYGKEYDHVNKCHSLEQALICPEIRKVAIAAPAILHFKLARASLLAGKDVFVEKPLCLNILEAEELTLIAKSRKAVLMVGHLLQYHPCIVKLQELVRDGDIGRIHYITSNRLNLGKIRQEENALWSFAPHDISVVLSLVGGAVPRKIRTVGGAYISHGVADTTLTSLRFSEDVRAHIHVSWLNPFKEQKLTVVGSRGLVVFDDTKPWSEKLVIHRNYLVWSDGRFPPVANPLGVPIPVAEKEPLREECLHFHECCASRMTPRTDGEEGLRVLRVLCAAQESLTSDGEAVDLNRDHSHPFIHPTAIVDSDATVSDGCKIWHFSHVMRDAVVGPNCNIGQNVVISPNVTLGKNVKVQNNVCIYTGVSVEDNAFLGPSCVFTNVSNPRSEINRHAVYERTLVRRGASIGANATIVCGIELGQYCMVAAGAVVTQNVPDYALVVGAPARQRGWVSRHGVRMEPDSEGKMVCPESGLRYIIHKDGKVRCVDCAEESPLPEEMRTGTIPYRQLAPRR